MSCGQIRRASGRLGEALGTPEGLRLFHLASSSESHVFLSPAGASEWKREESETRKTWRGPADPSLGHGPALIDVFVYARGVAVFQRLLGVTLEKGGEGLVKPTKLRGFSLFLGWGGR